MFRHLTIVLALFFLFFVNFIRAVDGPKRRKP